jgi:hypothetical protein
MLTGVALKLSTHQLMRIDMGKRVKRVQGDRPSVGEVMDDRVIAREVAMVASCFLRLWFVGVRESE